MPKALEGENDLALGSALDAATLFGVKGKVALVTGGGSGIGAMITVGLASNGAKVYVASRKDTSEFCGQVSAKPEVRAAGGSAESLRADVAEEAQCQAMLDRIAQRDGRLNILINNAGTNIAAPLGKYPADGYDKVLRVNLRAVFHLTQLAIPLLRKGATHADPARVVNISSIQGIRAPATPTYAYSAAKAGVLMNSAHLASSLAPKHITVNSVCPGPFMSRMMRGTVDMVGGEKAIAKTTALNRIGSPEDAAASVLYLCGKGGSFVTGATIAVDGGTLVKAML
eukprot:TRINITY_DN8143_c0_g1_i1.p1 TRINITY_DN8143_c0_g1~~TRINITY_DN8143_c0_g1_i1.p1  ORF type:complete len:310 (+),score=110.09 TRINITY_DN8143_c0_g1_i1:80-931(+)